MSTSEAVIRLQNSVETIRQRISTIHDRMQTIDQRMDDLLTTSEQSTNDLSHQLEELRNQVNQRGDRTSHLFENLNQQVNTLAQQLVESVNDVHSDVTAIQQALQGLHDASSTNQSELAEHQNVFEQLSQELGHKTEEILQNVSTRHQERQPVYYQQLLQTINDHQAEIQDNSIQNRDTMKSNLQQQVNDKLTEFTNLTQDTQQQFDQHLQTSGQHLQDTVQNHVDTFSRQDDERRQKLGQETQNLANGLTDVGQNMSHLTDTLVNGGRDVGDAMQVANVGLNTVIGILNDMMKLMEEIESFA